MPDIRGVIFDLDGVLVDTAKYHFLAWKETANQLGVAFDEHDNELLKGVSRKASLDYILNKGKLSLDEDRIEQLLLDKNERYLKHVVNMDASEILPGVLAFIQALKAEHIKIGLGSASKNASLILDKCGLSDYFDVLIDGNRVTLSKPHPEVFSKGVKAFGLNPDQVVVFEDAISGILAANHAGCFAIGVGEADILSDADFVISGFEGTEPDSLFKRLPQTKKKKTYSGIA